MSVKRATVPMAVAFDQGQAVDRQIAAVNFEYAIQVVAADRMPPALDRNGSGNGREALAQGDVVGKCDDVMAGASRAVTDGAIAIGGENVVV